MVVIKPKKPRAPKAPRSEAAPVVAQPTSTAAGVSKHELAVTQTVGHPSYAWALNPHKLSAASRQIDEEQPKLSAKDRHDAIKERYVLLKGSLQSENKDRTPAGRRAAPKVENLADHDGTADTDEDENEDPE